MYHTKYVLPIYEHHFFKQAIWFCCGLILFLILQKINIKWFFNHSFYFYVFNIFLLILVLIIGKEINGARAWFHIGPFSLQPSEFMKVSLALYLTHISSKFKSTGFKSELFFLLMIFILILIPSILVFLEPDTGAILFYLLIGAVILFTSKINRKWFIGLFILIGSTAGVFLYFYFYHQETIIELLGTSLFYRMDRILKFQEGMQIENALISLGSAPFALFNLATTRIYIPESPTDFAFVLFSEVFGIAGLLMILLCYLLMDFYFLMLIKKERNENIKKMIWVFFIIFLFHQVQNIGMNLGLLPIMGIPLPFLSYGGSTIFVYSIFLGIIIRTSKKDLFKRKYKRFS